MINDGSEDNSIEIAHSFADPRIRVLDDGRHLGLPHRLNQITTMSRAGLIARMDADDLMHPDRLRRQVSFLRQRPEIDVAGTAAYIIDNSNRVVSIIGQGSFDTAPASVLRRGLFIHPTVMGRRAWFVRNPYDPRFWRAEDRELWTRSSPHSWFARIAEPLYYYREEPRTAFAKFRQSHATDRRILRQYGPARIGHLEAYGRIADSLLRDGACRIVEVAEGFWVLDRFGRNRVRVPLSASIRASAERVLQSMLYFGGQQFVRRGEAS